MEGGAAARDPVSDNSVNCFHFVTHFFLKAIRPFKPNRISNAEHQGRRAMASNASSPTVAELPRLRLGEIFQKFGGKKGSENFLLSKVIWLSLSGS